MNCTLQVKCQHVHAMNVFVPDIRCKCSRVLKEKEISPCILKQDVMRALHQRHKGMNTDTLIEDLSKHAPHS